MWGRASIITGLLGLLLLAGCGGDNEEPMTKAAFIKEVDAICRSAVKDLQAEVDDGKKLSVGVEKSLRAEIDGIEALNPPEDAAAKTDEILDLAQQAVALIGKGDTIEAGARIAKAERIARDYGIEACLVF